MKVIGIACSPRKEKNSEFFLKITLDAVKEKYPAIETIFVSLAGKNFKGCISCDFCKSNYGCFQKDDLFPLLEQLKDPDIKGIIIASPVYMGGMTSQAKAFIDRTVLFRRNGFQFRNKVAAAITIGGSRNGGQDLTLMNIHAAFMIHDMLVIPDGGATSHFGGAAWERFPETPAKDTLAIETMKNTGYRMAEMIKRLG